MSCKITHSIWRRAVKDKKIIIANGFHKKTQKLAVDEKDRAIKYKKD
jgi:hypothetical protein